MRILLLNTSFPPQLRSAARLFHELGADLVKRGHQVTVITEFPWRRLGGDTNHAAVPETECDHGMEVKRVRVPCYAENSIIGRGINLLLLPWLFYRAARSMGAQELTVVYSPPLTLGLAAWLLKRRTGAAFILNVQDIYPQTAIDLGYLRNRFLIRAFQWLERFLYRHADCVVVHSEGNRRYLTSRDRVQPERAIAIPNWVDTGRIRPGSRSNEFRARHHIAEQFVVCYAGTMGYAQDLTPILAAARALAGRPDILFLLVGEGVQAPRWRQMAEGLSNVRFLPLLGEADYAGLIDACDAGFVPLAEELRTPVVPAKLLDFMAAARPVIATLNPASDAAAIITAAECGFVFSPHESAGVAQAIVFLRENPDACRARGSSGRRYAEQAFSLHVCAGQYEALFRQVLRGDANQPASQAVNDPSNNRAGERVKRAVSSERLP